MSVRLDEWWWLLLALVSVPLCAVGWRWMVSMARFRRLSAVAARTVLMSILAVLLAGATLVRSSDQLGVVVVVDTSDSVRAFYQPGQAAELEQRVAGLVQRGSAERQRDDVLGVVYADGRARAVRAMSKEPAGENELPPAESQAGGTDLERAVRLAGAMIPPDAAGRIVLVSDGNQTTGDVLSAVRSLASRSGRVPVDVVPLRYRVDAESMVQMVDAPATAPSGATVTVRVVIASTRATSGWLRLTENGQAVDINGEAEGMSRRVQATAGTHVESVQIRLDSGRTHRFDAVWEPDSGTDRVTVNNVGSAFTVTPGRGKALIVDGVGERPGEGGGGTLERMLRAAGIEATTVGAEGVRADLLWLQGFDIVVLQNIAADGVAREAQRALAAYVTELGGGLVMVGGPQSFGAGGWKGTPIEPALPVLLDLPERMVTPSTAIVLVIDNSGSMGKSVLGTDRSQQEVANDGAALAIESMDKSDMVGVIVFNSSFRVLIPLQRNLDAKKNAQTVRSISADGGTNLPPALEEARRQLKAVEAETKHVIVLSDGVSMNKERIPDIVDAMQKDGIRVSTIAVGDVADANLMSQMARSGGGVFYRVVDPSLLPRVFVKAVRVVRTPMVREQVFDPVRLPSGSTVLDGLSSLPALGGLTLTQVRPEATVSNVLATPLGEPVLAHWSAGLGRVGVFTSDVHRWGAAWVNAGIAQRFWTQFARTIARASDDRAQVLSADVEGDRLRIRLEEADSEGNPVDGLVVPGGVYGPDGSRVDVRLAQIGPGVYEAVVPAPQSGTHVVTLAPRTANRALPPVVGGVVRPLGAEYRRLESNEALLEQIARVSGGRVIELDGSAQAPAASLFDRTGLAANTARQSLWRWLMIAAIGVLLLDVATRRVAWDRWFAGSVGGSWRRDAAAAQRERGGQAAATVERLKGVDRVRDDMTETGGSGGPTQLTEDDAARLAEAEAERRRVARIAVRRGSEQAAAEIVEPDKGSKADESTEPPSLLEAKRRARQRMDES